MGKMTNFRAEDMPEGKSSQEAKASDVDKDSPTAESEVVTKMSDLEQPPVIEQTGTEMEARERADEGIQTTERAGHVSEGDNPADTTVPENTSKATKADKPSRATKEAHKGNATRRNAKQKDTNE